MQSSLTAEERVTRAKMAAEARWGKRLDWETATIEECNSHLSELRAEAEKGGLILQRRMSIERVNEAECYNPTCRKHIDIGSGRFAGSRSRINPDNGVMETAYACSAVCFLYLSNNFKHSPGAVREPVKPMPDIVLNESIKPAL